MFGPDRIFIWMQRSASRKRHRKMNAMKTIKIPAFLDLPAAIVLTIFLIWSLVMIGIGLAHAESTTARPTTDCPDPNARCLARDNPSFYKQADAEPRPIARSRANG
jgi:hypothetical protein